uniref:Chemokine interleukin-8-like domain-containing protein n=1 Tax=Poecilia mexicana TaxID=48701 RepID=A0A3B3X5N7_9TELE
NKRSRVSEISYIFLKVLVGSSQGVQFNTGPVTCCDQFSNNRVPAKRIVDITKTHICFLFFQQDVETGFQGRLICFRSSTGWVEEAYNRLINSEGSGQQK